jgi:hypothetical protein
MARTSLACVVLALGLMSMGCCMCDAPYDYCGPVYTGGPCGPCCLENERIGSAFTGPYATEGMPGEYFDETMMDGGGAVLPDIELESSPSDYYDDAGYSAAPAPRSQSAPRRMDDGQSHAKLDRHFTVGEALAEVMPQTFGSQRRSMRR